MAGRLLTLCCSLLSAAAWPAAATEPGGDALLELRSALKETLLLARLPERAATAGERTASVAFWRLRLEPRFQPTEWLTVFGAYEQSLRVASSAAALGASAVALPSGSSAQGAYRAVTLAEALPTGSTSAWRHEADRLALAVNSSGAELTVGRQAIGWGRGVLFSAVDLFSPFTPLEVDREWRRGVDALRVDLKLGPRASAEVVNVLGREVDGSASAARVRGYVGPLDAELVGGRRGEDWFGGLSASVGVLDAELHAELAGFVPPEPWPWGGAVFGGRHDERLVLKSVVGASYQLPVGDGLRVLGEYHFNGFGLDFPADAVAVASDPRLASRLLRGDFQTLGRHLAALSVSYGFGMTLNASVTAMASLADGSGVAVPSLAWDLGESVTLTASGYAGWGPSSQPLELGSPFGDTPLTLLLQVSLYDARGLARPPAATPQAARLDDPSRLGAPR